MKNIKGFTMIELLTTIIILGLLTTLAYFGVSAILNRGSNSYYNSQENMIVLAGKEYFADYREKLPKDVGDTSSVTLDVLIDELYIEPVKDEDENECNSEKTTVVVQKITDKDYQYYVTLVCDSYKTTEDSAEPVVIFSPNKKSSTKAITVSMEVTDNKDVASYRYVITKDGEEYRDSGYENYTGPITIKLTEKGLYEIVGYAYDSSGNRGSKRSGKYSIYKGINCAEVEFDSNVNVRTWTNKDITVTMKLPDNTYRWELSKRVDGGEYETVNSYIGAANRKISFDSEGKHQLKLVVYDDDGNSCIATTGEYYIDKTKPTCESSGGSSSWTNDDITLKGTCSDKGGSGCAGNATKLYDKETNKTNQSPGTVKDKAGNSVSCPANQTVKIDKTKPTCKSSGGSSSWTNGDRTLKGTCSDKGGSGCAGNVRKTFNSETNTNKASPGKVKDKAGNTTTCPANQTVRIDKTAPTCKSSGGNSSWTDESRTLKGTCSDKGGSGCVGNISKTFNSETNTTKASPGTVKDKAGNTTTCPANQTVRIDKTKPTCKSSGGNSSWTNGSRTIKGTCSDKGGSGCAGNVSKTFNSETNTTKASPGTVKDNAGNSATCPANQTVRIDKTAPTCKSSGGSTAWTTGSRTLIGTCSDKGGSGCVGNVSKKIDYETNQTNLSPGTVKDKAGNSAACPANQTVRIDRTAPSCPSFSATIGERTWTNKDITYTFGFTSDTTKWRWYTGTEGGSWTDWGEKPVSTKKVSISGSGKRTIKLRVYDSVGNSRECFSGKVYYIDKTKPTVTYNNSGGTYKQKSLKVCATIKDSVGIDNIRFRIYKSGKEIKDINRTSVNATSKQECYTLSGYGSYTVYVKAYDYANNKQSKSPENDYGYYYQKYTLKDPNPDKNLKVTCSRTCKGSGCSLKGYDGYVYYNDGVWQWNISGVGTELDKNKTELRYSTKNVKNYAIYTMNTAPWGTTSGGTKISASNNRGYAYFNSKNIKFSRSYAKLSIVGTVCTTGGECKSCTVTK